MACIVGSSWPKCIFGLFMHLIEDRHMMLTYYFKYALLYWTLADVRDYDMWDVRMSVHLFRSCGSVRRSNFTMICGA